MNDLTSVYFELGCKDKNLFSDMTKLKNFFLSK
jgi:hypothetical protein